MVVLHLLCVVDGGTEADMRSRLGTINSSREGVKSMLLDCSMEVCPGLLQSQGVPESRSSGTASEYASNT